LPSLNPGDVRQRAGQIFAPDSSRPPAHHAHRLMPAGSRPPAHSSPPAHSRPPARDRRHTPSDSRPPVPRPQFHARRPTPTSHTHMPNTPTLLISHRPTLTSPQAHALAPTDGRTSPAGTPASTLKWHRLETIGFAIGPEIRDHLVSSLSVVVLLLSMLINIYIYYIYINIVVFFPQSFVVVVCIPLFTIINVDHTSV
jgi:hypothetical protein